MAEDIKKLRDSLELTQEALARELGVSFSTVSRWERGIGNPSPLARQHIDDLQRRADRASKREERE